MSRIATVAPRENYRLEVQLDNGSSIMLNLEGKIHTIRFGLLADKEFFNQATTDGCFIHWNDMVEISVNEIFQLMQK
jgi:hypothetical protein